MIRGMTNEIAVPSYVSVTNAGDKLETVGIVLAAGSVLVGLIMLFTNGNPIAFIGAVLGVLLMIAGHTKSLAAMAYANYVMQSIDSGRMTEREMRTEQ